MCAEVAVGPVALEFDVGIGEDKSDTGALLKVAAEGGVDILGLLGLVTHRLGE